MIYGGKVGENNFFGSTPGFSLGIKKSHEKLLSQQLISK
jgi:hypothetical protein